jgi:bifunctional non-homologous end joining protein LigD
VASNLSRYQAKRDFGQTPEPRGAVARPGKQLHYYIQRHAATRLHYDFRLELDGVLKSWAVPKGPSLSPKDRRLAVHVEDHPMDYGTFEGVIPKGNYGAGTVILWDRGVWTPVGDPAEAYAKGHLKFHLEGEKLHGGWTLVRIHGKGEDDADNWLLIKERDEFVRDEDITVSRPESVAEDHADQQVPQMDFQLATLFTSPPSGAGWVYEIKLDGYRVMAEVNGGRARLITRGGKDWTHRFSRVARALEALPVKSAVYDGEMVIQDAEGVSDFGALAEALGKGDDSAIVYFAFDLLFLDGRDLRKLPLVERKEALRGVLAGARGPLRYLEHIEAEGEVFLRSSCALGLEGSVAKRADRPYVAGRGDDWRKLKCLERQELVVVGWSDPAGSRKGFGALLLGTRREDGKLRYAGKVGTGFDDTLLDQLHARMVPLARKTPPVVDPPAGAEGREAHWIEPTLVAEIAFTGWTSGHRLRHPTFKGLREDKPAEEVVLEQARTAAPKEVARAPRTPPNRVAGIVITHPERVVDATSGLRKGDLAAYYEAVADRVLPDMVDRALAVVRCPDGTGKVCFFQKHVTDAFPDSIHAVRIEESGGATQNITIRDLGGVVSLVQMGVLEIHPWGSRVDQIERPDRLIFDLDPDPALPWSAIVTAAERVRERLKEAGLTSFVRTTGGKGLHVVAPVERRLDWELVKPFTKAIADSLVRDEPTRYTSTITKSRRVGKIFIDYLRNARGSTAIASWSTRARPGAPVSVPVAWEELAGLRGGDRFKVADALVRAREPDPWEGFFTLRQSIPVETLRAYGLVSEPPSRARSAGARATTRPHPRS